MKPVYLGLLIGGATLALMMALAVTGYRLGYDSATNELEAKAARQAASLALAHAQREAELRRQGYRLNNLPMTN